MVISCFLIATLLNNEMFFMFDERCFTMETFKLKILFFFFCFNLFDTRQVNYLNREYHFFIIRSNKNFDKIILKRAELDYSINQNVFQL